MPHLEEYKVPLAPEAVEGDEENDAGRGVGQAGEVVVQEDVPVQLGRVEGQARNLRQIVDQKVKENYAHFIKSSVSHLLIDLGLVNLDVGCSTIWPMLPKQMGLGQN